MYGGRWNSPGRPVIYCASSLSLAMLEILVHVSTEEDVGVKRLYFPIELPADAIETAATKALPRTWKSALNFGPCRHIGDAWLERGSALALRVPSAIVPSETNVLLNPLHPTFAKVAKWGRAQAFHLDPRLVRVRGAKS